MILPKVSPDLQLTILN